MFSFILKNFKFLGLFLFLLFLLPNFSFASNNTLNISISEFANINNNYQQNIGWVKDNSSKYFYGKIKIKNINPNHENISDIYIYLDNASLTYNYSFSNGNFANISKLNNNLYLITIPELRWSNFTIINYNILNSTSTPLYFNTSYSNNKIYIGDNLNINNTLQNNFNNKSYQNSCIYNISLIENLNPISNSNYDSFRYNPLSINGNGALNTIIYNQNKSLNWSINSGNCLYKNNLRIINYNLTSPTNIPKSGNYNFSNITLSYNLNSTFSNLRVKNILAISSLNLTLNKKILSPSNPTLYGTNVTWQVNGSVKTSTSLNYLLTSISFWVSKKNVDGLYTNISRIDVDGINNSKNLQLNLSPNLIVNSTNPFYSNNWLFNYSDFPSPITWMKVNFSIANDGIQLLNKSFSNSGNSIFYKGIFLVKGYFLEIEKNITSLSNNTYQIQIKVFNKGNEVTPKNSIVTIYDFLPNNFKLNSSFNYSNSTWFNILNSSNPLVGSFNGKLLSWQISPTNLLNVSFNKGPIKNSNNSLIITYNISGIGDYNLKNVYITGLDPQQINGAGSTKSIKIKDIFPNNSNIKNNEFYFLGVSLFILSLFIFL